MNAFCSSRSLVVAAALTLLSAPTAVAVEYTDFPPDLQQILDERIAVLNANGGICIAGRVTMSDGKHITGGADVQVNLHHNIDEPLRVYEDGWFIMRRTLGTYLAGVDRHFVLRAFGYDPIDAEITVLDGETTYLEFTMAKTPSEELASVMGVVLDENGQPFFRAGVTINFGLAVLGTGPYPAMSLTTDASGVLSFSGLSVTEYKLVALAAGYAQHADTFTPASGATVVQDRRLYPNRRITIEYVYQADGSRGFVGGSLETGLIDWPNGSGGFDFSQGAFQGRDLHLRQVQDALEFRIFYSNGRNGYYDAGAIEFESIVEADVSGYSTQARPCLVGHVYVVRTYEEDNYAKFVVLSDEASFRTVVPGDPAPIEFAGYGLTLDFSHSSDYAQVSVEKHFADAPLLGSDALPYFLDISGMTGVVFSADLIIRYDEADVIQRRLFEQNLTLLRSTDQGQHWLEIDSTLDPVQNTLTVEGLTSFGYFAIADLSERTPGDVDGDGDVDLRDVAGFQVCFTGTGSDQGDPACVGSLFDSDGDVDGTDFAGLYGCMSAPNTPADPACAN